MYDTPSEVEAPLKMDPHKTKEFIETRLRTEREFLLEALRQMNENRVILNRHHHRPKTIDASFDFETIEDTVVESVSSPGSTMLWQSDASNHWVEYSQWIEQHNAMKTRLEQVTSQLQDIEEMFQTSEYNDCTGYRGYSTWAKKAFDQYSPTCDSISAASVFGAGITYTTVFSASRGNVGLMCWAFALFDVGFIVSLFVRSLLLWCSRLPALEGGQQRSEATNKASKDKYRFLLRIGDLFLLFIMFVAFSTQAIAIFLLNVTLLQLTEAQDNAVLTMSPVPSAALSLGAGALGVIISSGILIKHWMTHGLKYAKKPSSVTTEELFL